MDFKTFLHKTEVTENSPLSSCVETSEAKIANAAKSAKNFMLIVNDKTHYKIIRNVQD